MFTWLDYQICNKKMNIVHLDCGGPLNPEVVWSTALASIYPASSVLVGPQDEGFFWENQTRNYWLAERDQTQGQGFIIKVDSCVRSVAGFHIKNKGGGLDGLWVTKAFRISGSLSQSGSWENLFEAELKDTRRKTASLLNFTFDEPAKIQFLKFDLISFWGSSGGGIQYFLPFPPEGKHLYL